MDRANNNGQMEDSNVPQAREACKSDAAGEEFSSPVPRADQNDVCPTLGCGQARQPSTLKDTQRTLDEQADQPDEVRNSLDYRLTRSISANKDCKRHAHLISSFSKSLSGAPIDTRQAGMTAPANLLAYTDQARSRWPSNHEHLQDVIGAPLKVTEGQNSLYRQPNSFDLDIDLSDGSSVISDSLSSAGRPEPPFRFAGILAVAAASLFFSIGMVTVKMLPGYDGFSEKVQVLFCRGSIAIILCSTKILCTGSTFRVGKGELLVNGLCAVVVTVSILSTYCALDYISAGDSTAIVFSAPIWTSILGFFVFGEPLNWVHFVGLPASLFGIALVAHPTLIVPSEYLWTLDSLAGSGGAEVPVDEQLAGDGFNFDQRWPGIAISLLGSLLVALSFIVFKFRKTTDVQVTVFWLSLFMASSSAALMCFVGPGNLPTSPTHWLVLLANGVSSWLGQLTCQWAFAYEDAGLLSIVRTLDVAFTFVLSAVILGDSIYWTTVVGASLIALVVTSIILSNWIASALCCSSQAQPTHQHSVAANKHPTTITKLGAKSNLHLYLSDSPQSIRSIRT